MKTKFVFCTLLLTASISGAATAQGTRLLRSPSVSREQIAFAYASDLWIVPRAGGVARRLTVTPTVEIAPKFSPDGERIAYTATVGGNTDVYVASTAGGEPTRLTFHPGMDAAQGWTPDGRRVVFRSDRNTPPHSFFRLWSIDVTGGMPDPLPLPRAYTGALSQDGKQLAYEEVSVANFPAWAHNQSSQWRHY